MNSKRLNKWVNFSCFFLTFFYISYVLDKNLRSTKHQDEKWNLRHTHVWKIPTIQSKNEVQNLQSNLEFYNEIGERKIWNSKVVKKVKEIKRNGKFILHWTLHSWIKAWKTDDEKKGFKNIISNHSFTNCPYQCFQTYHKGFYNIADAIIVDGYFHNRVLDVLPSYRPPGQIWIWRMVESPQRTVIAAKMNFTLYDDLFNATMTYSRRSDIVIPIGQIISLPPTHYNVHVKTRNFAANKSRKVFWMVSNCYSTWGSRRNAYVAELQKHIQVDVYGLCGTGRCTKHFKECASHLNNMYKFYLGFENSLCEDYITEKLYRTLRHDIIPVVLGGANYNEHAPHSSFIDVQDFKSPKDLAEYLNFLDRNDAVYNMFFQWKYNKYSSSHTGEYFAMCKYLSEHQNKNKVYKSISSFWSPDSKCKTAEQYYKFKLPSKDQVKFH